jgi:hypothetical protein
MNIIKNMDIAQMFWQNISKIYYIINYNNICVCFYIVSDKNKSNSEIEHFISNINIVSNIIQKKCIGIIISNINIPDVMFQLIDYENTKNKNEFIIP